MKSLLKNFFSRMNQSGVSYWAIIIVLACFVAALIIAFWPQDELTGDNLGPSYIRFLKNAEQMAVDINEKAKIEKWLIDNKLNEYGEAVDTLYAGGTPLYNEITGKTMTRYEYILKNHLTKPWNK